MHLRLTPANDRVAHISLKGSHQDVRFVDGVLKSVTAPIADLRRRPDGPLDCQLRYGATVLVLEEIGGWSFGQSVVDQYVGYFKTQDLGESHTPTYRVVTFGSHVYATPSLKTVPVATLPFLAEIQVSGETDGYAETPHGYIPCQHLRVLTDQVSDPVETAERHIGVPYLWGGDSHWGIDCSGLVQAALASAGVNVQRDTDMQQETLGNSLPNDAVLQRGDVIFWKGHVGLMQSETQLIHANAHHMAVTSEDLETVCARILKAGYGPITARKRL